MTSITFRNNWPLIEWIVGIGWTLAVLYITAQAIHQQGLAVFGDWTGWLLLLFVLVSPFILKHVLRCPLTWLRVDAHSVTITEQRLLGRTVRTFAHDTVGHPQLQQKPDNDGGFIHSGLLPLPDGSFAEFSRHPNRDKTVAAVDRLRAALATQIAT